PATNDMVAFRDQVRRAPEVEVRKRLAEIGHERFDVVATPARIMQRILQQHVGRGKLVPDIEIAGLAPEIGEPSADDRLVALLFAHRILSFVSHWKSPTVVDDLHKGLMRETAAQTPFLASQSISLRGPCGSSRARVADGHNGSQTSSLCNQFEPNGVSLIVSYVSPRSPQGCRNEQACYGGMSQARQGVRPAGRRRRRARAEDLLDEAGSVLDAGGGRD